MSTTDNLERSAATSGRSALLNAHGIQRSFGGVMAVNVAEFSIDTGSIVALIGPNGAGKTTFFNVLTGFEKADAGRWNFDGHDLTGKLAYAIARTGMVRTFQAARVFPRLSVVENVVLGAQKQKGENVFAALVPTLWRDQDRRFHERARELVEWVGLGKKADDLAGTLSGGQRKLLDLARATMSAPKLLMLDEPMAGVNPALRQQLLDKIASLPGQGVTVLFVEHDMDVVSAVSNRVVCMAEGKIIADGTAAEVAANEQVVHAYLGGSVADLRDMSVEAAQAELDEAARARSLQAAADTTVDEGEA